MSANTNPTNFYEESYGASRRILTAIHLVSSRLLFVSVKVNKSSWVLPEEKRRRSIVYSATQPRLS